MPGPGLEPGDAIAFNAQIRRLIVELDATLPMLARTEAFGVQVEAAAHDAEPPLVAARDAVVRLARLLTASPVYQRAAAARKALL